MGRVLIIVMRGDPTAFFAVGESPDDKRQDIIMQRQAEYSGSAFFILNRIFHFYRETFTADLNKQNLTGGKYESLEQRINSAEWTRQP